VLGASATLTSTGGRTSTKNVRFQARRCGALPFKPRMTIRVGRRGGTRRGTATPLTATVRMPAGHANLAGIDVTLPRMLNARVAVVAQACTPEQYDAGACAGAKIGTATAVTPLLRRPLRGAVYFVRRGPGLPDIVVALRGEVAVDLTGTVVITRGNRLRTNFGTIPDVPIRSFTMRLGAGRQSPVGLAQNLCLPASRRATMGLRMRAQNGKVVRRAQRLVIAGCAKAKPTKQRKRS
jgi:hypothetical protein